VESKPSFLALLRKISALALFGFLAVVLAGPILSVLFVVLTFALIGFVLWLPVHALLRRKDANWREGVERVRDFTQSGLNLLAAVWVGSLRLLSGGHTALRGTASIIGMVLLETVSGAVVGMLLVSTCWPPHSLTPGTVVLAALVGAVLGVLVVVSRARPAEEGVFEQSPEGLNP
jgi:hypothetical protein